MAIDWQQTPTILFYPILVIQDSDSNTSGPVMSGVTVTCMGEWDSMCDMTLHREATLVHRLLLRVSGLRFYDTAIGLFQSLQQT